MKQTHATDTFVFISHTTNVLLFKFLCNIFVGVRIIKEMPGSVASGTPCSIILLCDLSDFRIKRVCCFWIGDESEDCVCSWCISARSSVGTLLSTCFFYKFTLQYIYIYIYIYTHTPYCCSTLTLLNVR